MKSAFFLCGFVLIMRYYDADSYNIENVTKVAVRLLLSIFASDHFSPTGKQRNKFVLVSRRNRRKSRMCVAKVLRLYWISCKIYEEKNQYIFFAVHGMHTGT